MNEQTNYKKIIAVTVAVVTAASAIAYVVYRLCRNFMRFSKAFHTEDDWGELTDLDFDELAEKAEDEGETKNEETAEETAEETTEEAPAEELPAEATAEVEE